MPGKHSKKLAAPYASAKLWRRSGDVLGRIGRLLEEGIIQPDVASVYALQDAAQAWKDIAEKLPRVHGMSPSEPGAPRRKKHGKIVLRVA